MATLANDDSELSRRVAREADALAAEFEGIFAKETVERVVAASLAGLAGRRGAADDLPTLVARFARERLRALAVAEGLIPREQPEVLFVCVHNAGRSQMAAVLLHDRSGGRVGVRSAGSAPGERVNPAVVEVMKEIGLDLATEFPKPLTDEAVRAADVVITMGCGDACPVYPGVRYRDWKLDDPAGQPVETVRWIRDQIDARVRGLLAEMGIEGSP